MNFDKLNDKELINVYGIWLEELKKRNIIKSNNVVGEIGQFLAINYYNSNETLPNLCSTDNISPSIDALSNDGNRYSIKTTTGKVTSVFYGFNEPDSSNRQVKPFEYVIVVILNKDYSLSKIIELDYKTFMNFKKWNNSMSAWNLPITEKLLNEANIIFDDGE